jgi:hypothetical protein
LLNTHSGQLGKRLQDQAREEYWTERRKATAEARAKQAVHEARARAEQERLQAIHSAAAPWLNSDKSGYQVKGKVRKPALRIQKHRAREQDSRAQVLARPCICSPRATWSGFAAPSDLHKLALSLRDLDCQSGQGHGQDYATWWESVTSPEARFERVLCDCGQAAARRAAGKFGRVSSTSIAEATAAGRAAVVRIFRHRIDGRRVFIMPQELESPGWLRIARHVAIAAGTKSLLGDLTAGQVGRTSGLRSVRRAAVETLDSLVRGGLDSAVAAVRESWVLQDEQQPDGFFRLARRFDALPGPERELVRSGRARALDLVGAVRRVRAARLGEHVPKSKGWQARLALVVRRYSRIARVLSGICQGESLELACNASGFAFDARKGCSRAWNKALDESGVRVALCVATGHGSGARGSVGCDIARATV